MSIERALLVRVPADTPDVRQLLHDLRAAAARIALADAGDRVDVIRYEALATQLERIAWRWLLVEPDRSREVAAVTRQGPSLYTAADDLPLPLDPAASQDRLATGEVAIELRLPLGYGPTPELPTATNQPPPARPWRAVDKRGRELQGTRAVEARFRDQIKAAVARKPGSAIAPSGVANRVLTEGLLRYVRRLTGVEPCEVPVRYQDGSLGPPFPLRCLALQSDIPKAWSEYDFSMLSIRHTELDAIVDGAWLRNSEISRIRPAGDTDRLAYEQSREQFDLLTANEPAAIYLYQTGFEAAVVGIYRAAVHHMLARPDTLAIVPMYFRQQAPDGASRMVAGYQQKSHFKPGAVWKA